MVQLTHPDDPTQSQCVHVVGTGTTIWEEGWRPDKDGHDRPFTEHGLGIWADPRRFFRVRLQPGDDLRELSRQIFDGLITDLEREFTETELPRPGEAEGCFGSCQLRTPEREQIR